MPGPFESYNPLPQRLRPHAWTAALRSRHVSAKRAHDLDERPPTVVRDPRLRRGRHHPDHGKTAIFRLRQTTPTQSATLLVPGQRVFARQPPRGRTTATGNQRTRSRPSTLQAPRPVCVLVLRPANSTAQSVALSYTIGDLQSRFCPVGTRADPLFNSSRSNPTARLPRHFCDSATGTANAQGTAYAISAEKGLSIGIGLDEGRSGARQREQPSRRIGGALTAYQLLPLGPASRPRASDLSGWHIARGKLRQSAGLYGDRGLRRFARCTTSSTA